jgi:putative RecB family exonuclease
MPGVVGRPRYRATVAVTETAGQGVFEGMPTPLYAASPSRLLAYLECPRRYRFQYLDRPRPAARPQRAHTSVGIATHNALRDWWDLPRPERTAAAGVDLVRKAWIDSGFRDDDQSGRWRSRVSGEVQSYLVQVDPDDQPRGIERTVAMRTESLVLTGRVDRIDERPGPDGPELVIVDYKTSRRTCTEEDARTSLPLALYAAAAWKMFRRRTLRVELHHVPTGTVAAHTHTVESLRRKLDDADSLARDARAADASYRLVGVESPLFPPLPSALCTWCDYRAACPEGQRMGPEKSSWAALEPGDERRADGERYPEEELLEGSGGTVRLGGRAGQPEGRGGEDDLGGQPGGSVRRAG